MHSQYAGRFVFWFAGGEAGIWPRWFQTLCWVGSSRKDCSFFLVPSSWALPGFGVKEPPLAPFRPPNEMSGAKTWSLSLRNRCYCPEFRLLICKTLSCVLRCDRTKINIPKSPNLLIAALVSLEIMVIMSAYSCVHYVSQSPFSQTWSGSANMCSYSSSLRLQGPACQKTFPW